MAVTISGARYVMRNTLPTYSRLRPSLFAKSSINRFSFFILSCQTKAFINAKYNGLFSSGLYFSGANIFSEPRFRRKQTRYKISFLSPLILLGNKSSFILSSIKLTASSVYIILIRSTSTRIFWTNIINSWRKVIEDNL